MDKTYIPILLRRLPFSSTALSMAILLKTGTSGRAFSSHTTILQQLDYPPTGEFPESDVVDFCLNLSKGCYKTLEAITAKLLLFWGYILRDDEEDIIENAS